MSSQVSPEETERAVRLEQRASELRIAMLRDRDFMAGLEEGCEQAQRVEFESLADLERDFEPD